MKFRTVQNDEKIKWNYLLHFKEKFVRRKIALSSSLQHSNEVKWF